MKLARIDPTIPPIAVPKPGQIHVPIMLPTKLPTEDFTAVFPFYFIAYFQRFL